MIISLDLIWTIAILLTWAGGLSNAQTLELSRDKVTIKKEEPKEKPKLKIEVVYKPENCERKVSPGDKVTLALNISLPDGTLTDFSMPPEYPFMFEVGVHEVLPMIEDGTAGMCVDERRRVFSPAALAFGRRGFKKDIPPNSDIIMEAHAMKVEDGSFKKLFKQMDTDGNGQVEASEALVHVKWASVENKKRRREYWEKKRREEEEFYQKHVVPEHSPEFVEQLKASRPPPPPAEEPEKTEKEFQMDILRPDGLRQLRAKEKEHQEAVGMFFNQVDQNHDGFVTLREYLEMVIGPEKFAADPDLSSHKSHTEL